MQDIDLRVKVKLNSIYSDGVVTGISKNKSLYFEIRNRANELNLKVYEYIKTLGFEYARGWKKELTDEEAKKIMKKLFHNKEVFQISDIQKKNRRLYSYLNEKAQSKGITTEALINELGFNLHKEYYPMRSIYELCKNYVVNIAELARMLGFKKQNLDQRLKTAKVLKEKFENYKLSLDDIELIKKVINERIFYYEDKENKIKIYKSINKSNNIAVVLVKHDKPSICFDLPDEISELLVKNNYDKYDEQDMDILNYVNFTYGSQDVESIDYELRNKINYRSKKLKMTIEEYRNFLGIRVENRRKYSEEDIKKILEKYLNDDGIVKIPSKSKDYIRIFKLADKRGFKSLKEFINSFGYNYERIRDMNFVKEKYIEVIKERYIVTGNRIYFSSFDPFYRKIAAYCTNNKISINNFVNKLGFKRIVNSSELPRDYVQYDWKTEELKK